MPPGNEEKKDSVTAYASTLANTDIIGMCVVPMKIKNIEIQILFIAPTPCLIIVATDVLSIPAL